MRLRLEARSKAPAWLNLTLPLIAVGATLILCSGLIALAGVGVFEAYGVMFSLFEMPRLAGWVREVLAGLPEAPEPVLVGPITA